MSRAGRGWHASGGRWRRCRRRSAPAKRAHQLQRVQAVAVADQRATQRAQARHRDRGRRAARRVGPGRRRRCVEGVPIRSADASADSMARVQPGGRAVHDVARGESGGGDAHGAQAVVVQSLAQPVRQSQRVAEQLQLQPRRGQHHLRGHARDPSAVAHRLQRRGDERAKALRVRGRRGGEAQAAAGARDARMRCARARPTASGRAPRRRRRPAWPGPATSAVGGRGPRTGRTRAPHAAPAPACLRGRGPAWPARARCAAR